MMIYLHQPKNIHACNTLRLAYSIALHSIVSPRFFGRDYPQFYHQNYNHVWRLGFVNIGTSLSYSSVASKEGKLYEEEVVETLRRNCRGMNISKTIESHDYGIDFRGYWRLPSCSPISSSSPSSSSSSSSLSLSSKVKKIEGNHPGYVEKETYEYDQDDDGSNQKSQIYQVMGQAKKEKQVAGVKHLREFEGALARYQSHFLPPFSSSASQSPVGIFVSYSGYSQFAVNAALQSSLSLILATVRNYTLHSFVMNERAKQTLPGLIVTSQRTANTDTEKKSSKKIPNQRIRLYFQSFSLPNDSQTNNTYGGNDEPNGHFGNNSNNGETMSIPLFCEDDGVEL